MRSYLRVSFQQKLITTGEWRPVQSDAELRVSRVIPVLGSGLFETPIHLAPPHKAAQSNALFIHFLRTIQHPTRIQFWNGKSLLPYSCNELFI